MKKELATARIEVRLKPSEKKEIIRIAKVNNTSASRMLVEALLG